MRITNWSRDDDLAQELTDDDSAKGWYNESADEAVVRAVEENLAYAAYRYTPVKDTYKSPDRLWGSVLFRNTAKTALDSQITEQLKEYPEGVDQEAVQRLLLDNPQDLHEWALVYGAYFTHGEKIGMCKDSGGEVALFAGGSSWGRGAYVAEAYESGVRGQDYVSVGVEQDGYYTVDLTGMSEPRNGAIELMEPYSISFDSDGTITVEKETHFDDVADKKIVITPTEKGCKEKAWDNVR